MGGISCAFSTANTCEFVVRASVPASVRGWGKATFLILWLSVHLSTVKRTLEPSRFTFPTCLGFVEPCFFFFFQAVLSTWRLASWLYQVLQWFFFFLFFSVSPSFLSTSWLFYLFRRSHSGNRLSTSISVPEGYISHSSVMDNFMCQLDGVKGCSGVQLFLGRRTEMPVYPR